MIPAFVVTLREVFEIMLISGIVYSILTRENKTSLLLYLFLGIFSALLTTVVSSFLLMEFYLSLEDRAVEIFEGITMIIGAVFITTFIMWVKDGEKINVELQKFPVFFIPFVLVLREGLEIILFLFGFYVKGEPILVPSLLGGLTGFVLGLLFVMGLMKMNVKMFLSVTGALLILFSAGLVSKGIGELQEAGLIPFIKEELWNLNEFFKEELYLLHEEGLIGSILSSMFGYTGDPSLLQAVSYFAYLGFILSYKR